MSSFLLLLSASVRAPAMKDPPPPDYQVVHATCLSTTEKGIINLESTFVINDPGESPDLGRGHRFVVRYTKFPVNLIRPIDGLQLGEFHPGDRSYWVVCKNKDGEFVAVDSLCNLTKDLLPDPYALMHLLTDMEKVHFPTTTLPNEITTRELARVITKGLRLRTPEDRAEFIRQESHTKNKYVKQYLEWLEAKKWQP